MVTPLQWLERIDCTQQHITGTIYHVLALVPYVCHVTRSPQRLRVTCRSCRMSGGRPWPVIAAAACIPRFVHVT